MNVNNNNKKDDVETEEDKTNENKITKKFDAILKDIKNNGRTTKLIIVKSQGSNINLNPVIIKLLNARRIVIKKDYGFDEIFNTFGELDNNCNKLHEYNPRSLIKFNTKSEILKYLKTVEYKLIDMLSTPNFVKEIQFM